MGRALKVWDGNSSDGIRNRLFETTWENERPDVAIETFDLIARKTRTSPVLFALTAEP